MNSENRLDWPLVLASLALCGLGLFFLYSASHHIAVFSGQSYVFRQSMWLMAGCLVILFVMRFPATRWFDLAGMLYLINIVLLILVHVVGNKHLGAQRWLSLGPLAFQPSELSKIIVIFILVRFLGGRPPNAGIPKTLGMGFLLLGIPVLLILTQPDLGTSFTLVPVFFGLLWVWGLPGRWWFGLVGAHFLLSPLLWFVLKDYQKRRLLLFLDPSQDPLGAGYSVIQSKIAIGSGGFLGKGWLSGTQNKLNFLPEHHTDFIFSVVGEEWGFVGCLIILFLYWIVIWRGFHIAAIQKGQMERLLAVGIVILIAVHVFVNISMTMGLMPVVGLPLPLVSYGGSSLVTTLFCIGLLLALRWQAHT